jgi:hypothetical protein
MLMSDLLSFATLQDITRFEGEVLFYCFRVHSLLLVLNFAMTVTYNYCELG